MRMVTSTEQQDESMKSEANSRRSFIASSLSIASVAAVSHGNVFAQSVPSGLREERPGASKKEKLMEHRKLGPLEVSSIGLGCLPFVGYYGGGPRDRKASVALIRTAHDLGVTFFDTAEVYAHI